MTDRAKLVEELELLAGGISMGKIRFTYFQQAAQQIQADGEEIARLEEAANNYCKAALDGDAEIAKLWTELEEAREAEKFMRRGVQETSAEWNEINIDLWGKVHRAEASRTTLRAELEEVEAALKMQREATQVCIDEENRVVAERDRLKAALQELVSLVDDPDYEPDSFTTQPARQALQPTEDKPKEETNLSEPLKPEDIDSVRCQSLCTMVEARNLPPGLFRNAYDSIKENGMKWSKDKFCKRHPWADSFSNTVDKKTRADLQEAAQKIRAKDKPCEECLGLEQIPADARTGKTIPCPRCNPKGEGG